MSSSNRFLYQTAMVLDQATLDACHDNLACQLELAVDVETSGDYIRASDRNKYVGNTFYEALLKFPVITRTVGEWLTGELEFSNLSLTLNNVTGRWNEYLPGGANFSGWIGKTVSVKLGLRNVGATYTVVFSGRVKPEGGFQRDVRSFTLVARDDNERANQTYPGTVFKSTDFPFATDSILGKNVPVIYGDFTINLPGNRPAVVPGFVTNGNDPYVHFEAKGCVISIASPAVVTIANSGYLEGDKLQLETDGSLPSPLSTGTTYFVRNPSASGFNLSLTLAGALINTSGAQSGNHRVIADPSVPRHNVKLWVSENALQFLDTANVYLKRGDTYYLAPVGEVTNLAGDNRSVELKQDTLGTTWVEGEPYQYASSDQILLRVKGKNLGAYSDNFVAIAKDILKTYGGLTDPDFHGNWATYRDKATPAQSAISTFKARDHQQEPISALSKALSLLEQVRLEAFVDRSGLFKINSLHFEDWNAAPAFRVRNWDVVRDTWKPKHDLRNNFNRAKGLYGRMPDSSETEFETRYYRNNLAITQALKPITKRLVYPNAVDGAMVQLQVTETLRLASSYLELVEVEQTWRSLLLDVGDFVKLNVQIGASHFEDVPAMMRTVGYDPNGLKVPITYWSFQMTPFPGWAPGSAGITGGYNATITQE